MTFVYNEIIILRFCGFEKNTAVEISKRSVRDTNFVFEKSESEISEKSDEDSLLNQNESEGSSIKSIEKL